MTMSISDRQMNMLTAEDLESMVARGQTSATAPAGTTVVSVTIPTTGLYSIRTLTRQLAVVDNPDNAALYINATKFIDLPTIPNVSATPAEFSVKKALSAGDVVSIKNPAQLGLASILVGWLTVNRITR